MPEGKSRIRKGVRQQMNNNGNHSQSSAAIFDEQSSVPGVRTGRTRHLTTPIRTNGMMDAANPDVFAPPLTDTGSMPAFKYPFSLANKRVYQGGWSREVTERELPVSKD